MVIYDANNGTRESRQQLAEKFDKKGIHVIFLGTFFFPKKNSSSLCLEMRGRSLTFIALIVY